MNKSSESMANSPPGISNLVGRPPTATMNRLLVTTCTLPLLSVHSMVLGPVNLPDVVDIRLGMGLGMVGLARVRSSRFQKE
jgi:hypothetical protein